MHRFRTPIHYFSYNLNREVKEVYWHTIINSLALSLVFIFEPIYLYSLGFSLVHILWFYVMVYGWYIIFITFGARFASRFGYKHSILVSNVFYVIYWILLFLIASRPTLYFVAPIFFALQKSWFWPAYNADIAIASVKIQRGREVGVLFSLIQLSFIAGPFLGGFVSEQFGFLALFISAAILMLFSAYPLFKSPEIYSKHEFKFSNFWKIFRTHKRNFFGYWGYAENLMIMSLWPVYMFMIIPNFFDIGSVATIAAIIGTMLMLYIGKLTDKIDKRVLTRIGAVAYGATWFFRSLWQNIAGVFTFDALGKTGKDALNVPMMSLTFERAKGHSPDHAIAYSVFYEFSLAVGQTLMAIAGIVILTMGGSVFAVFALAGVLTMFYALLK